MRVLGCALMMMMAAVPAAAQEPVQKAQLNAASFTGKMLTASGGTRLAPVYHAQSDGSVQIIMEGRLVTVPASTLTAENGKLMTSLTKRDVMKIR